MEQISVIWTQWVAPIFCGLSLTSIITAVIYGLVRGYITKLIKKINISAIEEKAVDKGVEKIKDITFKHDIMPLVESKLEGIGEDALSEVKKLITENTKKYEEVIEILSKFSAFFDDSITISAETKNSLKTAILNAQSHVEVEPEPVESEIIFEEPIVEKKEKKVIKR